LLIVLAEVAVVAMALFIGASFWAVARAPGHLRLILSDLPELTRVIGFFDRAKLSADARRFDPVLGFAKTIAVWDHAHVVSLRTPRNLLLVVMAADLLAANLLSRWCLLTAVAVLVLPRLFPLPDSAKNNNVTHIRTIVRSLIKWHDADPKACEFYCTSERPDLSLLHGLVFGKATGVFVAPQYRFVDWAPPDEVGSEILVFPDKVVFVSPVGPTEIFRRNLVAVMNTSTPDESISDSVAVLYRDDQGALDYFVWPIAEKNVSRKVSDEIYKIIDNGFLKSVFGFLYTMTHSVKMPSGTGSNL
jgi:hypothetical protein